MLLVRLLGLDMVLLCRTFFCDIVILVNNCILVCHNHIIVIIVLLIFISMNPATLIVADVVPSDWQVTIREVKSLSNLHIIFYVLLN